MDGGELDKSLSLPHIGVVIDHMRIVPGDQFLEHDLQAGLPGHAERLVHFLERVRLDHLLVKTIVEEMAFPGLEKTRETYLRGSRTGLLT
jgi:hypothetical protein